MTILTLFLILNPAAVAAIWLSYPARRNQRETLGIAVAVAAIGSLGLMLSVVVADPLLDTLDVSDATFRIAAGVLVLLGGAQAFLGFGLRHNVPSTTWLFIGMLVWLLSPPQLVAAAAVRVDRDIAIGIVAAVAATTIAVFLGYVWTAVFEERYRVVLDWARRILAAGAVVGGVELVRQGVLTV